MGKRVPPVNESGQALHSDTIGKAGAAQEKGLRSPEGAQGKKASGDLVSPIAKDEGQPGVGQEGGSNSLFERLQDKMRRGKQKASSKASGPNLDEAARDFLQQAPEASHEHLYQEGDTPPKGELARVLKLEGGRDKLLVNQKKLTDKVRLILNNIEASDGYIKSIALKIMNRKHVGIVLDIPKREEDSAADPSVAKLVKKKSS